MDKYPQRLGFDYYLAVADPKYIYRCDNFAWEWDKIAAFKLEDDCEHTLGNNERN